MRGASVKFSEFQFICRSRKTSTAADPDKVALHYWIASRACFASIPKTLPCGRDAIAASSPSKKRKSDLATAKPPQKYTSTV